MLLEEFAVEMFLVVGASSCEQQWNYIRSSSAMSLDVHILSVYTSLRRGCLTRMRRGAHDFLETVNRTVIVKLI